MEQKYISQPAKQHNKGGYRVGSGRKKGAIQKLSGSKILQEIQRVTGKRFEQLLAEHYMRAYNEQDWNAVRDYEKTILAKVVADKHEIDHTTLGESLHASFNFPQRELPDWNNVITIDAKD